jgi:hypothetical protein
MSSIALSGNAGGSGAFVIASPNSNSSRTLTLPDGTGTFTVNGVNSNIVSGTAVASTSGTSIAFTGIPSWVKRITVMCSGVSTNGTSIIQVQLGVSGIPETTGYSAISTYVTTTANTTRGATATSGFIFSYANGAAETFSGSVVFTLLGANTWTGIGNLYDAAASGLYNLGGVKTLAGTLNMIRITTVNGTDTFDAGTINILYE